MLGEIEVARHQSKINRDKQTVEDRIRTDPIEHTTEFERNYGATLSIKNDEHIRIMTKNIRYFPLARTNEAKYDMLKQNVQEKQYDFLGLTETNYNWHTLPDSDQLHQQTRGWWKNQAIKKSWLITDCRKQRQIGGTASIAVNSITSHIGSRGSDERQLGRWSWVTITDPAKIIYTTIITIYHPCRSNESGSVNGQQLHQIRKRYPQISKEVFSLFVQDLRKLIKSKITEGHHVMVMGDFNTNTQSRTSALILMLRGQGLRDPIYDKYGGTIPATHMNGSEPIDAIFCTHHLKIQQGGHCSGDIAVSDHKVIWVDISRQSLLGASEGILRPIQRKLQSNHPCVRNRFNKILERQLKLQGAEEKYTKLLKAIESKSDEAIAKEYEGLDNIRRRAIQHSEKKCLKTRKGNIPFSPELTQAIGYITMWKLIYKRNTSQGKYKPRRSFLLRKAIRWKFPAELLDTSNESVFKELTQAIKHYSTLRRSAKDLRLTYLEKKAAALELEGGKYHNHIKRLMKIEEIREVHSIIRYSQKDLGNSSLSYIEMGSDTGPREIITDQQQIETKTMEANIAKLTQADNTPFYEEPLLSLYKASQLDYDTWEEILNPNTPIPPNLERGTQLWFRQMKRQDTMSQKSKVKFSEESYQESWKKMKETTSSHPGLHFGHFKAMHEESPLANTIHTALANVPMETGYSPNAWRVCTNAMLKKKSNDLRPEKLRLVTLMDAQFNHNNKHLGRIMMKNGEKNLHLATEQYGSRKNKSAVEHALNKVMTLDLSRVKREAIIFIANDAVSCYDRILLLAAYLTMLKFGIPKEAAQSVITTLGKMEHHIRTAKGDSTRTYGGTTWIKLPHGIGQGNGSGPAIWACVSTPLFEALRAEGYGVNITTPISTLLLNITGFAFVDDTDLIQTMGTLSTEYELSLKAQAQLLTWEELLRTTGGAIDPNKSDWLFIRYRWKQGEWTYETKPYPLNLTVRDKEKTVQPLRQLQIAEARETLGVWIAGTCQWKTQTQKLKNKSEKWTTKLQQGRMTETIAQVALNTTIYRTLAYSLPATYLNEKECKDVLRPLLYGTLPRLGVVRTMSRKAVHLPKSLGGLGIPELYVMQGIEHIKILLLHGGQSTATGILLQSLAEYHTIEAGSLKDLFQLSIGVIHSLTHSWLRSTLLFLHKYAISIDSDLPRLCQWTKDDRAIMDVLCKEGTITASELLQVNRCRLYLQVITLSEIITSEGIIIKSCWNCEKYTSLSSTRYDWATQPRPCLDDIKTWQRVLYNTLRVRPGKVLPSLSFPSYLKEAQDWATWRYEAGESILWEARTECWRQWKPLHINRHLRQIKFGPTGIEVLQSQKIWAIATVREDGNTTSLLCTSAVAGRLPSPTQADPWINVGQVHDGPPLQEFLDDLLSGRARCISDGSAKDGRAAMAFRNVGTDLDHPAFQGGQGIPGSYEDNNSFRSEAAGLLGLLTTVNLICIINNISSGGITVGCDSKSALRTAFHKDRVRPCQASRDIIQAIHHQIHRSPLTWTTKHVKGHQDDVKDTLTDWEQANVDVDLWAKAAREEIQSDIPQTRLPGETWRLLLHSKPINSKIEKRLLHHCWKPTAIDYWEARGRMLPGTSSKIDWKAYAKGVSLLSTSKTQCITKLFSGFHATGKNMKRRRQWPTDHCPFCDCTEDHIHLLQCTSDQTTSHFTKAYGDLDDWLQKTTSPDIAEAIYLLLTDHKDNQQDSDLTYDNWSHTLCATVQHQRSIGSRSFTEGFLSTRWEDAQQEHYNCQCDTRHSAHRWTGLLVAQLHTFYHSLWTQRCDALHTPEGQTHLYQAEYATDLKRLLAHPPPLSMPTADRRFFVPLAQALSYSLSRQRRLINLLTTIFDSHELRTSSKSATLFKTWLATAAAL